MDRGMDKTTLRRTLLIIAVAWCCTATWAQQREAWRDSLEQATALVRKFPEDNDLRLRKASWNMMLEQWEYAKKEYDLILERDSNNVAALYFRAYVYEKTHRYKFARKDYLNMLKIVPGNFNGMLGLALLNQKDLRYTEAMDMANQLIQLYPDSAVAYAVRGGMEEERGMMEVAEYDYSEAIRHDPDNTDYLLRRADLRIRMGNKRGAKEDLDTAVAKGLPRPTLADLYARCKERE